ncbi:MAG TPA: N-acetylmuramoyl-L-alanine amidase [Chitinophagaceae bacterium]|jgi:N-acetylmuramoyl-L-alanine amidase|nr:N-acetylmuramoyl-L-alanine amidase [Chitinophagaceae bacterium]HMU56706.1 N-acetylmuramoyl-L-alanine amidase [Chitinophagaceae bacterium]
MREIILYLIQVVAASGIFYGYYHFVLRNKRFHKYNRFYLIASCILSLVVPFLNIPLYFSDTQQQSSALLQTLTVISGSDYEQEVIVRASTHPSVNFFTFTNILYFLYLLVAVIALLRIFFSINKIRKIAKNNPSEKIQNIRFINTDEPGTPFSFFRWLFWNKKIELHSAKGEQVFRHELFHIRQVHSLDIFFMELLTVAFWINPFFHLIKKEVKAIHEFLADQFAIHEDTKWEYAEMLLQQALDTKLNLVNPFFHNQIKRRIAMITTSKKPGHQYFRKLMALPVTAVAVGLFAFTYKNTATNTNLYNGKPVTVVIDAGHGGDDAGAKAHDGSTEKELTLAIAQKVKELNISNNVEIVLSREEDNTLTLKERLTFLEQKNADLFLSIHINSASNSNNKLGGFNAYVSGKNKKLTVANHYFVSSLSKELQELFPKNFQKRPHTFEETGSFLLEMAKCPSVMIDCGYITNDIDLAFIKQEANQENIAQAILNGINNYLKLDIPANAVKNELSTNIGISDTLPKKNLVNNENKIFDKVEIEASFPGGNANWRQYLERNMNPDVPINNKAPNGAYTTITMFIVAIDGSISDIRPLTRHGYGMEEEAIRVISKGPKWVPAIVNGKPVKSYRKQPITFQVLQEQVYNGEKNDNSVTITKDMLNEVVIVGYQKEPNNKIEEPAHFPGGVESWRKYLSTNINANVPVDSGAAPGTYKVEIQFIVDIDGFLSDIRPLTKHGHGMEQEAIRLISKGPKWIPAKQNGNFVKSYIKIPVIFEITEESDSEIPKISVYELKVLSINKLLGIAENSQIVSFTFTADLETEIVVVPNKGNQINPAIKNHLNTSKPGRLITFDDVIIIQNGEKIKVPSKVYKVVS